MSMAYCVKIGDPRPDLALAEKIIASAFSEIDCVYNNWNPHSEISQLNRLPAGKKQILSDPLAAFLHRVDALVEFTEGRFDPTIAPVKENLLKGELQSDASAIGWEMIVLEGNQFSKKHDKTALDLGGAAKGFAVDLILERLQEAGFRNMFVEWGGEIRVSGSHPEGRPWKVAIFGGETLELREEAIATSGSYLQNWTIDGTGYTHIVDPQTKQPLALSNAPIASASVLSKTCFEADAIATALMLFASQEEAYAWAEERGLKIWLF